MVNKLLLLPSIWFFYTTLPTLMMHGQTQIKNILVLVMYVIMKQENEG